MFTHDSSSFSLAPLLIHHLRASSGLLKLSIPLSFLFFQAALAPLSHCPWKIPGHFAASSYFFFDETKGQQTQPILSCPSSYKEQYGRLNFRIYSQTSSLVQSMIGWINLLPSFWWHGSMRFLFDRLADSSLLTPVTTNLPPRLVLYIQRSSISLVLLAKSLSFQSFSTLVFPAVPS